MSLRAEAAAVLAELSDAFDDWDAALWFAQPNSWLQGCAPVDLITLDPSSVYQAAWADRFVARD